MIEPERQAQPPPDPEESLCACSGPARVWFRATPRGEHCLDAVRAALPTSWTLYEGEDADLVVWAGDLGVEEDREALTRVRTSLPLFALTTTWSRHTAREAVSRGADDVLPVSELARQLAGRLEICLVRNRRRSLNDLEVFIEQSPDAILVLDEKGSILHVNAATEALFGISAEQVSDRDFGFPIESEPSEVTIIRRNGDDQMETVSSEMQSSRTRWNGEPAFIVTLRDISAKKAAAAVLERHARELERSNRDLEHFASIASHQLLQPLVQLQGFARLLREDCQDRVEAESLSQLDFMIEAADQLRDLVSHLLVFSKIGRQERRRGEVSVAQIFDQVIASLQTMIDRAGAKVTRDEDLPTLLAEESELEQLLQNLVENALKHGVPDRLPLIHLSARSEPEEWQLSLQDNGPGIAPEDTGRIFEMFERGARASHVPGTGMGLAICHKIVRRVGGEIWVQSGSGEGARFVLSWPKQIYQEDSGES